MNKAVAGLARLAGSKLGGYLDDALRIGGQVGQDLATAGLKAGKAKFAPQMVGAAPNEVPRVLREGAKSAIPTAGRLLGQGTVLGGLYGLASMADQQSEYSQPMSNSVGNAEIDRFLMKQALMQQQFQHDVALERARAEARTPGAQYGGSLLDAARAEREMVEAGETTNREVLATARSIYGTGLRAY
jgi:hypothetical protein|tara:strand:- start:9 stop:569 length:561 start_codon:yes stop_codon:yes gene_type:complete